MQNEFEINKTLAEKFITDVFIKILNLDNFDYFNEDEEKEKIRSDMVLLNYDGKQDQNNLKSWVSGVMLKMAFSKIGVTDQKNALLSLSVYLDRPDIVTVMLSSARSESFNIDLKYFKEEPGECLNKFMTLLDDIS